MRSKVSVEREAAIILKHFIIIYFLMTLILMLYLNLSGLDTTLVAGGAVRETAVVTCGDFVYFGLQPPDGLSGASEHRREANKNPKKIKYVMLIF